MKKFLLLITSILLMPCVGEAKFYRTERTQKCVKIKNNRKNKITRNKCTRCVGCKCAKCGCFMRKMLCSSMISIAQIGTRADKSLKKTASFSPRNKFSSGEIVIVEYKNDYVYGKVSNSGKDKKSNRIYVVVPTLTNPFMSLHMRPERIGKIQRKR